jgi:hypothetical protein
MVLNPPFEVLLKLPAPPSFSLSRLFSASSSAILFLSTAGSFMFSSLCKKDADDTLLPRDGGAIETYGMPYEFVFLLADTPP